MIAITSAMIVPSIFNASDGSVEEESDRLRIVLRLAMEESQLSGVPIQWLATKNGWSFEMLEQTKDGLKRVAYEIRPFQAYVLPADIHIEAVEQVSDFNLDMKAKKKNDKSGGDEEEPVIGMVLFLPDGTTSQSNIRIVGEQDDSVSGVLQVRPGPGGIRLQKPDV